MLWKVSYEYYTTVKIGAKGVPYCGGVPCTTSLLQLPWDVYLPNHFLVITFFWGKITWLSFGYKKKWLSQMGMFGDAYWFPEVHCHAAAWFPQTYTTRVGGMPASWLSSRHTSSKISRHTRLPSGDLIELWKMAIHSGFSHGQWRFSIVMLVITGG